MYTKHAPHSVTGKFNRIRKRTMKKKKSSVLRTRRLSGKVLTFLLGAEDDALREFADDSKTGRAGKTLVKEDSLRITFVALKKGTVLPSHRVAGPVSIQTIRGCLRLSRDRRYGCYRGHFDSARAQSCSHGKSTYRLRHFAYICDVA